MRRIEEAGYGAPWEMDGRTFEGFVQSLPATPKAEFDRIDRALHAGSDISEFMKFHAEMFRSADPLLFSRLRGIGPEDHLKIFSAVPGHRDQILPGDAVALDRRDLQSPKSGQQIVQKEIQAKDVDWLGKDTRKWVYAPYQCRNHEASVHDFLVGYALQSGLYVPSDVRQEYLLR